MHQSYWMWSQAHFSGTARHNKVKQGSDGDVGTCFGRGGGHTVALLQALDDAGRFSGFVGAEASLNGRSRHNAVVAQLVLV